MKSWQIAFPCVALSDFSGREKYLETIPSSGSQMRNRPSIRRHSIRVADTRTVHNTRRALEVAPKVTRPDRKLTKRDRLQIRRCQQTRSARSPHHRSRRRSRPGQNQMS